MRERQMARYAALRFLLLLLLLLKIFKEGGPSAAAVFQEALHLNT